MQRRILFPVLALIVVLLLTACETPADTPKQPQHTQYTAVTVVSGGVLTGRWIAEYRPRLGKRGLGWSFTDAKSGQRVRVSDPTMTDLRNAAQMDSVLDAWGDRYGDLSGTLAGGPPDTPEGASR